MEETELPAPPETVVRRRGKELRERVAAAVALGLTSPVFAAVAGAIKVEGWLDPNARGPVFFVEERVARGRVIGLLKFRTLTASALSSLGPGPTHIKALERSGEITRVGRVLKNWYLDELPQLINIVRGDMGLIGTRPYPIDAYLEEVRRGINRKRDMPSGLIGPVQSQKGHTGNADELALDAEYWEIYLHASRWRLLATDVAIIRRAIRVQLEHKGI